MPTTLFTVHDLRLLLDLEHPEPDMCAKDASQHCEVHCRLPGAEQDMDSSRSLYDLLAGAPEKPQQHVSDHTSSFGEVATSDPA
ncbi:Uu.00g008830.m01.CDS01 [Anthostomella pinea]|uniref:Uu.00g008830.m01.CDS01 n=1 Tax=Anthostomella pinea TaxID=933095 RepID=A0AAI8VXX8_9PEZI|nr:Uu.00g008830.m01.CDS01 [Anthostomella pinea]